MGEKEGKLLNLFFVENDTIKWKYYCQNVISNKTTTLLKKLPVVDLCFLLKVSDCFDSTNHKPTEELIKTIKAKTILLSFSKKTVSGKMMNHPGRGWVDRMLKRLDYSFEEYHIENEIIYVIKKHF